MHDQQRLAALLLEGHRVDGTVGTFLIGPNQARIGYHLDVLAEECHGLRALLADLETVPTPDTYIRFAGKQGHAE